jgi:hypothetical protein
LYESYAIYQKGKISAGIALGDEFGGDFLKGVLGEKHMSRSTQIQQNYHLPCDFMGLADFVPGHS